MCDVREEDTSAALPVELPCCEEVLWAAVEADRRATVSWLYRPPPPAPSAASAPAPVSPTAPSSAVPLPFSTTETRVCVLCIGEYQTKCQEPCIPGDLIQICSTARIALVVICAAGTVSVGLRETVTVKYPSGVKHSYTPSEEPIQ